MASERVSVEVRALVTLLMGVAPLALLPFAPALPPPWLPILWTAAGIWFVIWLHHIRSRWHHRLRTLSSVIAAFRENDFSIQARRDAKGDALDDLFAEVNSLGERLRSERLHAQEASALLRTVVKELDVAVFAFDRHQRLRFVNPAGERLLPSTLLPALGKNADELNLASCLEGPASRVFEHAFPGAFGRWQLRRRPFREGGIPHQLLVLTDLSQTLREEEREAWKRLLRVLGHELKNSLAPMKSIADSLPRLLDNDPRPSDWEADVRSGLRSIAARAESLERFLEAFSKVARLPPPNVKATRIDELIKSIAALPWRVEIKMEVTPEWTLHVDSSQLEQVLINLTKNAAEAAIAHSKHPLVTLVVRQADDRAIIEIIDNGPGLDCEDNLFVPFFTTKKGGVGVGLFLSRQIAEAHGGRLTLKNRDTGGPGCVATLDLPAPGSLASRKRPKSDTRVPEADDFAEDRD